ncbi:hypothetical protein GCM10010430_47670 [Kitasatospora cystarginea]|uniref:LysR substrate-binding domain-containing protein n=1 Tax=Kitasatospora cystarginea TaxID=58350 RepID=A0ABN3EHC0_9ACTN
MRMVRAACAAARRFVPAPGRIELDRCWGLAVPSTAAGLAVLSAHGLPSGDAVLGALALGGWGIGLVPVHSNRRPLTGSQHRTGEPPEAEPAPPFDG